MVRAGLGAALPHCQGGARVGAGQRGRVRRRRRRFLECFRSRVVRP
jgi:hypothetical protein